MESHKVFSWIVVPCLLALVGLVLFIVVFCHSGSVGNEVRVNPEPEIKQEIPKIFIYKKERPGKKK